MTLTLWTIVLIACSDLPWWVALIALVMEVDYEQ